MTEELSPDLRARLALMERLVPEARAITLPLFHTGVEPEDKSSENGFPGFDPVTAADRDAEAHLRERIADAFPDDTLEGEEFDDQPGISGFAWTLDPIDGTRAFVAGVPVWSTLIAVSEAGHPRLGLIDLPALDQQVWGTGESAWRIDARGRTALRTRPCPTLEHAILGCTAPFGMFGEGECAAYRMVRSGVRFSRLGLDALGYALVASGRMDIIVEAGLKPCDVRALIPVVEGAGGRLTDWRGGDASEGGRVVAVGDARLLPELYEYLGRALE